MQRVNPMRHGAGVTIRIERTMHASGSGRVGAWLVCLVLLGVVAAGCGKRAREAAPEIVASPPRTVSQAPTVPSPNPAHIGFLLPLHGPYTPFAQRILDGAHAARDHMAGGGIPISITVVDTSAEDWRASFEALPPEVRIVGGPLQSEVLAGTLASPGSRGRSLVAFMSELPEAVVPDNGSAVRHIVEGQDAWRFFTSPEDNVRALLAAVTAGDVGNLAVLYPDEPFGRRRSALFKRMAIEMGFTVATGSYAPDDPESWAQSTARLLEAGRRHGGAIEAVYIPDVWSQARMLIPNLLVQQKQRSLVLGSALWSQTMDVRNKDEALLFSMSVFPGAWWGENEALPAQVLRRAMSANAAVAASVAIDVYGGREPGYWEALGFDFVRLASRVGSLQPDASHEEFTAALQRASAMDWAMAPIAWDESGRASQDLYLFTPALYGPLRTNLETLREMVHGKAVSASASSPPPYVLPK